MVRYNDYIATGCMGIYILDTNGGENSNVI